MDGRYGPFLLIIGTHTIIKHSKSSPLWERPVVNSERDVSSLGIGKNSTIEISESSERSSESTERAVRKQ